MIPFARVLKYGNTLPEKTPLLYTSSEYSGNFSLIYNSILYITGNNDNGQLGTGNNTSSYNVWRKVTETEKVKLCSTGYSQTIYITESGRVMLTGNNITVFPVVNTKVWIDVSNKFIGIDITKIVFINIDRNGLLVILDDGSVWGTGNDVSGWSGQGSISIGFFEFKILYTPPSGRKAVACMSGTRTARILLDDGTILSSGDNRYHQCNASSVQNVVSFTESFPGVDPTQIYQFKMCNNHAMIILANKTCYGTGYGSFGSLNNGDTSSGNNGFFTTTVPTVPKNCRDYMKYMGTSSSSSSFYLDETDKLYGCGYQNNNLISTSSIGTFKLCTQSTGYENMYIMSASGNAILVDINADSPTIAASSPKTSTPTAQINVPTLGMGAVHLLSLPT